VLIIDVSSIVFLLFAFIHPALSPSFHSLLPFFPPSLLPFLPSFLPFLLPSGIFKATLDSGKLAEDLKTSTGDKWDIAKIYPLDATFDTPDDVPEAVKTNKRYAGLGGYTISEVRPRSLFLSFPPFLSIH